MTAQTSHPFEVQSESPRLRPLPLLIFSSRWLQLPLYVGLIVAQVVYVYLFLKELVHLVLESPSVTEQQAMLIVLPAVIGALVVGACADIEHPQCGRLPAGDRLARVEASPNDASGECRNVVATPMCADDSSVVSVGRFIVRLMMPDGVVKP